MPKNYAGLARKIVNGTYTEHDLEGFNNSNETYVTAAIAHEREKNREIAERLKRLPPGMANFHSRQLTGRGRRTKRSKRAKRTRRHRSRRHR